MTRPCRLPPTRYRRHPAPEPSRDDLDDRGGCSARRSICRSSLHRTAHSLGDVQVFFRAAWAVWTGYPLYQVIDHHGWSYHYPPIFAILMGPFADPLPGYPALPWALPFARFGRRLLCALDRRHAACRACLGKGARRPCRHRAPQEARAAGGRCGSHRCCCSHPISGPRSRAASRPRSSSCSPASS